MKMYTETEIMNWLMDNTSSEPLEDGLCYYIHIDEDGNLLPSLDGEVMNFQSIYSGEMDENFDFENPENPAFMEVVKDLTGKVNAWEAE